MVPDLECTTKPERMPGEQVAEHTAAAHPSVNVFASNLEVLAYYAGSKSHMAKASQLVCEFNVFLLICF
jgi:hypothetical protein